MSETGKSRPWHLWVVGVLGVLWNGFGCVDFTMTAMRNEAYLKPYPPEMLEYIFNQPAWSWAVWAIGVFGGLLGSLALLLRNSLALPFFLASFLGAAVSMANGYFDTNAPRMDGMEAFPFIILAIALALLVYAAWQRRAGTLS